MDSLAERLSNHCKRPDILPVDGGGILHFSIFKIELHKNTVSYVHLFSSSIDSNPWKEKRSGSVEDVGLKSMPLHSIGIPRADEAFLKDSQHAILETIKSVFEKSPGSFSYQLVYGVLSHNSLFDV